MLQDNSYLEYNLDRYFDEIKNNSNKNDTTNIL